MLTNQILPARDRNATDPLRARVHDLRNLFAVVASARSLLERPLDEPSMRVVIDGLARVAAEGKLLADTLLGGELEDRQCGSDAAAEFRSLAAMVRTLERPGLDIELAVEDAPAWILMTPPDFRAVVLELVTNAAAAGATAIRIRSARRGCRYWLCVGDDGSGFPPGTRLPHPAQAAGLHGTGLRRLASAVGLARGKVRIRSRIGSGSVVAIVLPIIRVLHGAGADRAVPAMTERKLKEVPHGKRSA